MAITHQKSIGAELETSLTKEKLSYMNGLREIWNDPSPTKLCKQVQSPYHGSEDETATNVSLSEGSVISHIESPISPAAEPSPSKRKPSGKLMCPLSELIPVAEMLVPKRDEMIAKVVNEKEGYIHVLRLAEMIADSLKSDTAAMF